MNEWEKRPTDFILGIILHFRTVIQINIIYFCLEKRDTGSGPTPLYPIMGFGQIKITVKNVSKIDYVICERPLNVNAESERCIDNW